MSGKEAMSKEKLLSISSHDTVRPALVFSDEERLQYFTCIYKNWNNRRLNQGQWETNIRTDHIFLIEMVVAIKTVSNRRRPISSSLKSVLQVQRVNRELYSTGTADGDVAFCCPHDPVSVIPTPPSSHPSSRRTQTGKKCNTSADLRCSTYFLPRPRTTFA